MLRIWQQVLQADELDVESNFFDLGGHSLLLTRMQAIVKSEFGVKLTAAEVFRHPTVGAMAAWLEQAQSESKLVKDRDLYHAREHNPHIIPIQSFGEGRPIFVISQSMIFRTFAAELGVDQPVYAIQTLDLDTADTISASFEKLVDFYVQQIRDVQPHGPYRVAGWCVSGWIAYGVARQLERQGEEIEMAMIIDAWAPAYWSRQSWIRRRLMLFMYHVQRFRWMERRLRESGNSDRIPTYIKFSSMCFSGQNIACTFSARKATGGPDGSAKRTGAVSNWKLPRALHPSRARCWAMRYSSAVKMNPPVRCWPQTWVGLNW